MKWYDGIDGRMIMEMKANTESQRMLHREGSELARFFEMAPDSDLLYLADDGWLPTEGFLSPLVNTEFTYRLRLDWRMPPEYDIGDIVMAECEMEISSRTVLSDGSVQYVLRPHHSFCVETPSEIRGEA